jgi:hypothetical protein
VTSSDQQNALLAFDLQQQQITQSTNISLQGLIKEAQMAPDGGLYMLTSAWSTPGGLHLPGVHRFMLNNGGQVVDLIEWDQVDDMVHIELNELNHLAYTIGSTAGGALVLMTPTGSTSYALNQINPDVKPLFIDANHILYAQGNTVGVIDIAADEVNTVQTFGSPVTAFSIVPESKAIAITTRDRGFIGRYFFD